MKGYPNKIDKIHLSFPTQFKDKYRYFDIDKGTIHVQIWINLLRYKYKKGLSCVCNFKQVHILWPNDKKNNLSLKVTYMLLMMIFYGGAMSGTKATLYREIGGQVGTKE